MCHAWVDRAQALKRVAVTCVLATAAAHSALAQATTRLDHNGSQMIFAVNGERAVISYAIPRVDLGHLGVTAGMTLFDGRLTQTGFVYGTAYSFSRACPPAPYHVQGILGERLVLEGAAPQRGRNCTIVGYRTDLATARLEFQTVSAASGFAVESIPVRAADPASPPTHAAIVLDYTLGVGGLNDTSTPMKQALNEVMPRHIYLKRLPGDDRELHVAWRVRPIEGDLYPALPNLFGSDTYPSGSVVMASGALTSDIVIRTFRTDRPDWNGDFEVVLTDERTGRAVLSAYHTPITVAFSVAGDLKCKIGRADRCDPSRAMPVEDAPAKPAAGVSVRTLLSSFCATEDIRGSECLRAKNYRQSGTCSVQFTGKFYSGRFIASSGNITIADYQSDCESHATEFGGSVLFETVGDGLVFRSFQPGYRTSDCLVIHARDENDKLVCILSHNGQGEAMSVVSEFVFAEFSPKEIRVSYNHLATASSNSAAYGLNRVYCGGDEAAVNLGLSKLGPGPTAGTVSAELEYADSALLKMVCASAGSAPDGAVVPGSPGNAFIPQGAEMHHRIVVSLKDRSMVGIDDFKMPVQAR
jgi:hypothetical protein